MNGWLNTGKKVFAGLGTHAKVSPKKSGHGPPGGVKVSGGKNCEFGGDLTHAKVSPKKSGHGPAPELKSAGCCATGTSMNNWPVLGSLKTLAFPPDWV